MGSLQNRPKYISIVEKHLHKEQIIVLVGQRRVGKSYLLLLVREILMQDAEANVIFIDKEKRQFDAIKTYLHLNEYIETHLRKDRHTYILIDEVQEIEGFEHSLRSFRTEEATDIIVTGSNAHMLSSDLSTHIGGRYKEVYIQPLSYMDFLLFHQLDDSDDSLMKYINCGGMPGLMRIGLDREDAMSYLMDIYHTALLKDVVMREKIRNVVFLENLVRFLADNTGKLISASSISKHMRSQGDSITPVSLLEYLKYLEEAYIISRVHRYDIHGKRVFESNDKYYFTDHGMRNAIAGGGREGDIEKVLENIVYSHLIRQGYRVYVGQLQAAEIDFVAEKMTGERIYVQVAYLVADEQTRHREFGNLQAIQDNYPKYVISLTPMLTRTDHDGVSHLHLRHFLTQDI